MIDPAETHQSKLDEMDVGIRRTTTWDLSSLLPIDWKLKMQ